MRLPRLWTIPLATALAGGAVLPARAQSPEPPVNPPPKEARAPIPPGVPTTKENVYLPTEGEIKLGREGSAEVEKIYKVVTSGEQHERLQRVAREVVIALQREEIIQEYVRTYRLPKPGDKSKRVPFEFTFKLVDPAVKEVNAFSLAGGPIYVTRGLMDYAVSDHELAAVLAHECAHVAFHHVEQLVRKQKKVNQQQLWGLLAAVIAGVAGGGGALSSAAPALLGQQLISIATLTGYGRELEHEADRVGVRALAKTQYHPVGMMTFMQKLVRDDRLRGNPTYGIFQSHPYSNERVVAIEKELQRLGFKTDLGTQRQVGGRFRLEVVPDRMNGVDVAELRLNGNRMFVVAAGEEGRGPLERAQRMAQQMQELFADNITFNDVRLSPDKLQVSLKGIPVLRVQPEDGRFATPGVPAGERAYKEIVRALLKEKLDLQN